MKKSVFYFDGVENQRNFVRKWVPENLKDVIGVVQIVHGMAEHSERYNEFAEKLVSEGFAVFANDHIGHGKTANEIEKLGYFADTDGWQKVVDNLKILTKMIKSEFRDLPLFLLGHSMGSFLLRTLMIQDKGKIDGVILSGTAADPGILGMVGLFLVKNEIRRKGKKWKSKLMTKLSLGSFNKAFKPAKTEFDWLSRDEKIVKKYIDDPYCGTIFTSGFFLDMLNGIKYVNKKQNIEMISKNLPILFISGEKDPVGNNGKGVRKVYNNFKKSRIQNVNIDLYPEARHEIFNEINRDDIYKKVIKWIKKNI